MKVDGSGLSETTSGYAGAEKPLARSRNVNKRDRPTPTFTFAAPKARSVELFLYFSSSDPTPPQLSCSNTTDDGKCHHIFKKLL